MYCFNLKYSLLKIVPTITSLALPLKVYHLVPKDNTWEKHFKTIPETKWDIYCMCILMGGKNNFIRPQINNESLTEKNWES